jgi:DNA polymerase-3 subunit beta
MVSASDPESGDGQESLTLDYQGKSFSTGFNAQYVLDALGLMYAPMVRWRFTGELSPVLLEPIVLMPEGVTTLQTQHQTRLAAAGFLAVVMPLRL